MAYKTLPGLIDLLQYVRRQNSFGFGIRSYAQEGEDLILQRLFEGQKRGFYVDVGAHHPIRFSNTYLFYKQGWRGINIDATPGSMELFRKKRPRDINLELAIAQEEAEADFYLFNEPALNTFDQQLACQRHGPRYRVVQVRTIKKQPLAAVLREYLKLGQTIDILSIDVEGLDLEVLRSNDWQRFPARCVVVEAAEVNLSQLDRYETHQFLSQHGYEIWAKTANTLFYLQKQ
jgi:FkbM family methyltransferase